MNSARPGQLVTAAVVEGHGQGHAGVAGGGQLLGSSMRRRTCEGDPVAAADEADAHLALVQLVGAAHRQRLVEVHQEADLGGRPAPVLGGEGVHGQPGQAGVEPPRRCRTGPPPPRGPCCEAALGPGPAAVAVHDDGHVVEAWSWDRGRAAAPARVAAGIGGPGCPQATVQVVLGGRTDQGARPRAGRPGPGRRWRCCRSRRRAGRPAAAWWPCPESTPGRCSSARRGRRGWRWRSSAAAGRRPAAGALGHRRPVALQGHPAGRKASSTTDEVAGPAVEGPQGPDQEEDRAGWRPRAPGPPRSTTASSMAAPATTRS